MAQSTSFTFARMMRLSSFQIGSAMGDILMTAIWNRVMINDFGVPALPVGFLIALRYYLAPLSLWAGYRSDTTQLWGLRRTSYIWLGRSLMVCSLPFLALSLGRFGSHPTTDGFGWLFAVLSSILYGVGTLLSGSPYLALVRESAPKEKQGLAISTAETVLIIFFAITGIGFSFWMQEYDPLIFWEMVLVTMGIGGFFWLFSIAGAEKRIANDPVLAEAVNRTTRQQALQKVGIRQTFRKIWADKRTRLFFFYLALSTLAAWTQDVILEPFGAEVFDLPLARTTRLNSYWQTATVITLVGGAYMWRKRPSHTQRPLTMWGLAIMGAGIFGVALTSWLNLAHLLEVALLVFGAGFGVYTFGSLSLMAVMSSDEEAGAYLGLWTIAIVVFKGVGTSLGGAFRDLFILQLNWTPSLSYGLIFALEAILLWTAVFLLFRLDVDGFAQEMGRLMPSRTDVQIATSD